MFPLRTEVGGRGTLKKAGRKTGGYLRCRVSLKGGRGRRSCRRSEEDTDSSGVRVRRRGPDRTSDVSVTGDGNLTSEST